MISLVAGSHGRQHICKEVTTLWSSTDWIQARYTQFSYNLTAEEKKASAAYFKFRYDTKPQSIDCFCFLSFQVILWTDALMKI